MTSYQRAADRYLGWLAVACVIVLPFIGPGAIVIWGLTALVLRGVSPDRGGDAGRHAPRRCRGRPSRR